MEAFYEEDFLLRRIGIFPSFGFVWQFFVKERKWRSDANARISIYRQQ